MRLNLTSYLIHGTNNPDGVGMRVTSGCIRMFPEHIEQLFPLVDVGTPVRIMSEPIKVGWAADTLYVEVHPPLEEESESQLRMRFTTCSGKPRRATTSRSTGRGPTQFSRPRPACRPRCRSAG
jgi:L,D-transpeptidase ErfK/SrfK